MPRPQLLPPPLPLPAPVLVTGASGRIGRAVCRLLQSRGQAVIGLDLQPGPCTTLQLDLGRHREAATVLRRSLSGCAAVVHCAALHAPQVGQRSETDFMRINVQGTQVLLDAAASCGVPRIVFTSTTALYGAGVQAQHAHAEPATWWVDEHTPPLPQTIYHRSKLAAEALLQQAAGQGGPSLRVLRMSRCFPEPPAMMAVYRLHRGVGEEDVASAHTLALAHPGSAHALWLLSHPTPFSRADAPALMQDAAALLRQRVPALATAFDARGWALPAAIDRVYDASKAVLELGWQPRQDWRAVLARLGPATPSPDGR